jgi:hypothetical protein
LDSEITIQPPLTLRGFCQTIVAKHSGNWPPREEAIAEEFLSFLKVDDVLPWHGLEKLCARLGINVSVQELPRELRGHNCALGKKREIVIGKVEGSAAVFGSQEHTLFHELRELIEYEFRNIGHPVAIASDLESRAEMFAATVRVQASLKGWEPLLDGLGSIQSNWGRFAVALPVLAIIFVHSVTCLLLPHWEDQLLK